MTGMRQRRLGRSGLELTELGLGGAPLGGLYSDGGDEAAADTLAAAVEAGIRYVDTAPFYGHGLSEHRVGAGLRRLPGDAMVLSTKVGRLLRPARDAPPPSMFSAPLPFTPVFDYSYGATMRSLEDSYQRLGRARIDLALIHDCNPRWHGEAYQRRFAEAMDGAYRALDELRGAGIIRAFGVGVNDPDVCLEFARAGRFDCFMLAGRYTLLDQSGLDALLPHCEREGIGILVAAPFNSGILATGAVAGARYFYEPAAPAILERVRRIEEVCRRHAVPLAAAALRFPLGHPAVTSVVVGCSDRAEVLANAGLIRQPIPDALWAELRAAQGPGPVAGGGAHPSLTPTVGHASSQSSPTARDAAGLVPEHDAGRLPGPPDVLEHDPAGADRVVLGQRLHQRLVLGHGLGPALGRHQRRVAAAAGLGHQDRVGRLEGRVARGGDQAEMDLLVEPEVVGALALPVVLDHALVQRLEPRQLAPGHAPGGELDGVALETADHLEQLENRLRQQPHHAGAAPRQKLDQPLRGQQLQGFPDRRPRHLQHQGETGFVQPAAGRDLAPDDHVAQPIADLGVQQPPSDRRASRPGHGAVHGALHRLVQGRHDRLQTGMCPL